MNEQTELPQWLSIMSEQCKLPQSMDERYRELVRVSHNLRNYLITQYGYDVPDKIWLPFIDAIAKGVEQ